MKELNFSLTPDERNEFLAEFIKEMKRLEWPNHKIATRIAWLMDALHLIESN